MNKKRLVYISLGSNMGDSVQLLKSAIKKIDTNIGKVLKTSSFYETEPWGFEADQNFVNAMICVESNHEPEFILTSLLQIEEHLGRSRNDQPFYESRPIDLDIIALENEVIKTNRLVIPHPKMQERLFVLVPFAEIESNWRHPLINKGLEEMMTLLRHEQKVKRLNS